MDAVLAGTLAYPLRALSAEQRAALRQALTFEVVTQGGEERTVVTAYTRQGDWVHVPRQYGLTQLPLAGLTVVDRTSRGRALPSDLPAVALRPAQQPFVADLVRHFQHAYDGLAQAPTGSGKSICALEMIRRLGRAALIIVDQDNLKSQWIAAIQQFWGLPLAQIGVIQGPRADRDKPITVALVQTLLSRRYSPEYWAAFGTVVLDEAHTTASAQTYSQVLSWLPARYRLGMSATLRRDALQQLLFYNLGPVSVRLRSRHQPSVVRVVEYAGRISRYAETAAKLGPFINALAQDSQRNALLTEIIVALYQIRSDILVLSDRVSHLEELQQRCIARQIPAAALGLYTGYRSVVAADGTGRPQKTPRRELEAIKARTPIILATYGMLSKGVDIPRLSAGVDATPRALAQQVQGRILRQHPGKPLPIWVTLRDTQSPRAEKLFLRRVYDYQQSNSEVFLWNLTRGLLKLDVDRWLQGQPPPSRFGSTYPAVTTATGQR